ncbi:MAG TPA: A24 family peptidase C-terminal domain-containing protein [Methanomicrobiales archaeon]|jgi:preflagellin peptidase FlaK|nr:A24 family peptidase C-terminal domain-containing protein [Methanomicrobiales archaeon]
MILPLLIASIAVLMTLFYASILDVRERSVPVRTWYPLYIIGTAAVLWYLITIPSAWGTIAGYAALIVTIVYGIELETEDGKIPVKVFTLAIAATVLQGIAWSFLWKTLGIVAIPGFVLLVACVWEGLSLEKEASMDENNLSSFSRWFRLWHVEIAVAIQGIAWAGLFLAGAAGTGDLLLVLVALYAELFLVFAAMNLFGGADAIALVAIALFVPVFPFMPLFGYPPLPFLPFSALTNAVILNLVTPAGIAILNLARGNRAPFPYTFFGYPVKGDTIENTFGFVMEDFSEEGGRLERHFIPIRSALRRMIKGKGRIYTKHLKEHPEKYRKELDLYRKAGTVWISYGVPFILPILAGFAFALCGGDILFTMLSAVGGW